MSEVKLNLIDAATILAGAIHGSDADRCIAALSAEPETIQELSDALTRYLKPTDDIKPFVCFRPTSEVDATPWDAGLVVIDLAARIVAADSTYSQPGPEDMVHYHDGTQATDVPIHYRLPADWLFVNSIEAYRWSRDRRREDRKKNPPLDARAILYGRPLLEFIVKSIGELFPLPLGPGLSTGTNPSFSFPLPLGEGQGEGLSTSTTPATTLHSNSPLNDEARSKDLSTIHADWLLTPRSDLRKQSPREVMLEKHDLIDFDLHTRSLQWSCLGEGPPCLAQDSFAYRFAGFGSHEWIVYYDLVRHLLWRALEIDLKNPAEAVNELELIKHDWLESGVEYEGRVPASIINNERRRLPEAATAAELLIDENCECCRMLAQDAELGLEVTFWHLDGCNMDEGFAFSSSLTMAEWEAEQRRHEEFDREFERNLQEREQRRARGEPVEAFPWEVQVSEDPF